ncbi:MAG: ATP phosphoribosyltransferase regulatory subunit, partial [Chloroflexota bacterium]|nr:ATP phosphoribosyltransferase regulatory subunit [Chloroflexota bacterium]
MVEESPRCRGMRDLLPADMARFRRVEDAFRSVCLAWGYQEVRTPTIEHLHLFTAAGTLSPQMLGRVYSFLDWDGWSGERVVLRPDATIPVARLFVEHRQQEKLAKLFYIQNVFRFADGDEPRESWQCGVELMGDTQPSGDVELILLGCQVLEQLGLVPVEVRLSHPGIVRSVLVQAGLESADQLRVYDRILDGDLAALSEVEERLPSLTTSLRLLFQGEGGGSAYLSNLRNAFLKAVPDMAGPLDELTVVVEALTALACRCRVATTLVRNFEYYTGPVFQFVANGEAVGSGGRYDGLIALVGGPPVPASGFALDAARLARLLPSADEGVAADQAICVRP